MTGHALLLFAGALTASGTFAVGHRFSTKSEARPLASSKFAAETALDCGAEHMEVFQRGAQFEAVNAKLLGPSTHDGGKCPENCGCPGTPRDCPRWYSIEHVEASAAVKDNLSIRLMEQAMLVRKAEAAAKCGAKAGVLKVGGWCLTETRPVRYYAAGSHNITIAQHHVPPSGRIVEELSAMIEQEKITSINDFGAGVGQYKAALAGKHPMLTYRAYDGAGNIEKFTKGFLKYFDLTLPLHLEKADWVMSLEVGEHVPSKYEGMMIRNLHKHNCKGVILSWGVLGQAGHSHVNDHGFAYLNDVFEKLGYKLDKEATAKFRNPKNNYSWFTHSTMVFRRMKQAC